MPNKRTNTPTEQNKEDNGLILYRLAAVELAVNNLSSKVDHQDNIKRSDLVEFKDTIINRVAEMQSYLQKQVDALEREKASGQELKDFKKQIAAYGIFISALVVAAFSYMLTRLR